MNTSKDFPTLHLCVPIDEERAAQLYDNASMASDFHDPEDRFNPVTGAHIGPPEAWSEGTVFWCARSLEAMVLADYEAACGYSSTILSDEYAWDAHESPYAVLSSRPHARFTEDLSRLPPLI